MLVKLIRSRNMTVLLDVLFLKHIYRSQTVLYLMRTTVDHSTWYSYVLTTQGDQLTHELTHPPPSRKQWLSLRTLAFNMGIMHYTVSVLLPTRTSSFNMGVMHYTVSVLLPIHTLSINVGIPQYIISV